MAIAPEGTLTAPAGAGPDSDMLVARPAMMPGPAGISALRTTDRAAGSIVDPTAGTRPAMAGSINTVLPGRDVPTSLPCTSPTTPDELAGWHAEEAGGHSTGYPVRR